MTDKSNTFSGGGWGDDPTNDPGQSEGTKPKPDVNRDPFPKIWTASSAGDSKLTDDK